MEMQIIDLKRKNFDFKEFFTKDNLLQFYELSKEEQEKYLKNGLLIANKIQQIRDLLNLSINITSGWRSIKNNAIAGGKATSQHLIFQAVDWQPVKDGKICRDRDFLNEIVLKIKKSNIEVDQCLIEDSWIHTSIKGNNNRNEFATYFKNNNGERIKKII
jgi:hypothetical protein